MRDPCAAAFSSVAALVLELRSRSARAEIITRPGPRIQISVFPNRYTTGVPRRENDFPASALDVIVRRRRRADVTAPGSPRRGTPSSDFRQHVTRVSVLGTR